MKKISISNISNLKVLESEEDFEFEGICGSVDGILWEDSLEQLFIANKIDIVDFEDSKWIDLKQDDTTLRFEMFLAKEGSQQENDHIDFNHTI